MRSAMKSVKALFFPSDAKRREDVWLFSTMLVGACLSLLASLVLSIEIIHLLENPDAELACDINEAISCASVMKYESANIFGWPNSFLGMMAEPVVITVAIAGLAGVRFPRAFMAVAQVFYGIGFVFALWLFYLSLYVIGALCPWCLLVTLTTTFVFFSLLRYNLRENNLFLSKKHHAIAMKWLKKDYDKILVGLLVATMAVLIVVQYGESLFA